MIRLSPLASALPTLGTLLTGVLLLTLPAAAQFDSVVVFNEIHYHPADDNPSAEFIELFNQNSVDVDLSDWRLEGAGSYTFPSGSRIAGRGYLVIARDPDALPPAVDALGPFSGALANDGETLTLRNHNGRIMDSLSYGDAYPWPVGPDGSGASLSKRRSFTTGAHPENWVASRTLGGTPSQPNDSDLQTAAHPVISEVAAQDESPFWVELYHPGATSASLTDFELLTGRGERFPLEGSLAAGAYLQVTLDLEETDGLRLFLLDTASNACLDAAIGRENGTARLAFPNGRFFFPQISSPGQANALTLDDRVVINEIMYHHRPDYQDPSDPLSSFQENDEEWIELYNRSQETVDLSGWTLSVAVRYEFAPGTLLAAGDYLVIARDAAALAIKHPDITIAGEFAGSLRNSREAIELRDPLGNPVDAVRYLDDEPWPADADGGGSSLELRHPRLDNSLPEAWAASDESRHSQWHTYTYRAVAQRPVYSASIRDFHELRFGFLQAGRCLVDNVSVIEDPDGGRQELVRNRTFGSLFAPITSSNWRLVGNHGRSEAIADPEAGSVLKLEAEGPMNYLNNICEASLSKEVEIGKEYEVSFDARWLGGSPMLRSEVYYNKFATKHILQMPDSHGTPGAQNSTYQDNPGPLYQNLHHHPAVPSADQPFSVSVEANDSVGIDTLTLHYSIDGQDWQSLPMTAREAGFHGTIPGQPNNTVVQFYIEGANVAGGRSTYPAGGAESGAFVRVDTPVSEGRRQAMRLITSNADSAQIHDPLLILSNARHPATVILNEDEIVYNCGIRLRGSMFSRSNGGEAGLNIKFPADHLFRGAHSTIIVRRRNPQEILVKHMANQAGGGVPASYNDLVELRGYRNGQSGLARMEMARFGNNYLKGAFPDGDSEPMFKMEGIRDFQQTGQGGVKLPMPIGWIVQFDLTDLGDDPEQYRHVLRLISDRREDDYSAMLDLGKAFGAPDSDLRSAVEPVIDTDQWARMMAIQTLCGIADVYPVENPHNFNLYRRPTDNKIIAIPWDWDFTFNLAASSRIIDPRSSNKNLWRVLSQPGINRLFRGHLLDLMDTIFNESYAQTWFSHYGDVAGTNYASNVSYVRSRSASVKDQAASSTSFQITTNQGNDFAVEASEVTLQGTAGVRVRTIEHVESGIRLEPNWIDDDTWELTLPLAAESNTITLQARDYQGTKGSLFNPAGSAVITVTNTGDTLAPSPQTLHITELMYHPAPPSEQEILAGFDDQDLFEFIELYNSGAAPLDLQSLRFTGGVQFDFSTADFTLLPSGETALLVAHRAAFEHRYGSGLPVLGTYQGNLSNGGERLTLEAPGSRIIKSLRYQDSLPWPDAADGQGFSLVLTDPAATFGVALEDPTQWGASPVPGGSPGSIPGPNTLLLYSQWVVASFSPDTHGQDEITGFQADPDADGFPNGVEFALGTLPTKKTSFPRFTVQAGHRLILRYSRNPLAAASVLVETSGDLQGWNPLPAERLLSRETELGPQGTEEVNTLTSAHPGELYRLRVSLR